MSKGNFEPLETIYSHSPVISAAKKDKFVIFSDLHMGAGGLNDDFRANASLFRYALENYYFLKDYKLILNGDVEELQRFNWGGIYDRWKDIYGIFDLFWARGSLFKLVGNHDIGLLSGDYPDYPYPVSEGLRIKFKDRRLFIFHGHQASRKYSRRNAMIGYTLRYLANPLGIKNYSVSHSSRKQYQIEKNAYDFANQKKMAVIIGHTHRPLFESLPKFERLKYRIESLIREYSGKELRENKLVRKAILKYKAELEKILAQKKSREIANPYIYNTAVHVPCLFNSGCVIGKRGMTCLEISNGKIRLAHWFDGAVDNKYLRHQGYAAQPMDNGRYFRTILNKEKLKYVFARIDLLA